MLSYQIKFIYKRFIEIYYCFYPSTSTYAVRGTSGHRSRDYPHRVPFDFSYRLGKITIHGLLIQNWTPPNYDTLLNLIINKIINIHVCNFIVNLKIVGCRFENLQGYFNKHEIIKIINFNSSHILHEFINSQHFIKTNENAINIFLRT